MALSHWHRGQLPQHRGTCLMWRLGWVCCMKSIRCVATHCVERRTACFATPPRNVARSRTSKVTGFCWLPVTLVRRSWALQSVNWLVSTSVPLTCSQRPVTPLRWISPKVFPTFIPQLTLSTCARTIPDPIGSRLLRWHPSSFRASNSTWWTSCWGDALGRMGPIRNTWCVGKAAMPPRIPGSRLRTLIQSLLRHSIIGIRRVTRMLRT
mmetsp:Transcript_36241/g.91128  ORF Transcript_36241/g.91128 Transcript_36241/m.91128 type:complete len:209 (+) Transcript_36241:1049-1675(+)